MKRPPRRTIPSLDRTSIGEYHVGCRHCSWRIRLRTPMATEFRTATVLVRYMEVDFQATCLALLVALFFTFALSQNCGAHGESDTPLSLRTLAPSGSPSFCGEPELSASIKLLVSSSQASHPRTGACSVSSTWPVFCLGARFGQSRFQCSFLPELKHCDSSSGFFLPFSRTRTPHLTLPLSTSTAPVSIACGADARPGCYEPLLGPACTC